MARLLTKLRMLRLEAGLSQKDLADAAGVSQPIISAWERGERPIPERHQAVVCSVVGAPYADRGELQREVRWELVP